MFFTPTVIVKCPACGTATELSDDKEFGFCTECGTKILFSDAELFTETPVPVSTPVFNDAGIPNSEHLNYAVMNQPQPLESIVFHNSDECAAYVNSLHDLIVELGQRFSYMNHAEESTCLDFLDRSIKYCDYLDTKKLRYLAGTTTSEDGKTTEDYGTYPVSKNVLKDIKEIRKQLVQEYNDFFLPKIQDVKTQLESTKGKISELPGQMKFFHIFCSIGVLAVGVVLLAVGLIPMLASKSISFGANWATLLLIVGAVIVIAWIVCFILYVLKGTSARQLYKTAKRQTEEIRTYKEKLKN